MVDVVVSGDDGVDGQVVRFQSRRHRPPESGLASGIDEGASRSIEVNRSPAIPDVKDTDSSGPRGWFLDAGPRAWPLRHSF